MFNTPTSSLPTITISSLLRAPHVTNTMATSHVTVSPTARVHRVTNTTAPLATGFARPSCPSCHKHDGSITCCRPARSLRLSCHKHDDNVTRCHSARSLCPSCHNITHHHLTHPSHPARPSCLSCHKHDGSVTRRRLAHPSRPLCHKHGGASLVAVLLLPRVCPVTHDDSSILVPVSPVRHIQLCHKHAGASLSPSHPSCMS